MDKLSRYCHIIFVSKPKCLLLAPQLHQPYYSPHSDVFLHDSPEGALPRTMQTMYYLLLLWPGAASRFCSLTTFMPNAFLCYRYTVYYLNAFIIITRGAPNTQAVGGMLPFLIRVLNMHGWFCFVRVTVSFGASSQQQSKGCDKKGSLSAVLTRFKVRWPLVSVCDWLRGTGVLADWWSVADTSRHW